MKALYEVGDVIQFNENHKWCGCLGIIDEVKIYDNDVKYLVDVKIPEQGEAYIFVMQSDSEIEYIGKAILVPSE